MSSGALRPLVRALEARWWRARAARRKALGQLAALALGCAGAVALLEVGLRAGARALPVDLGMHLFACYGDLHEGVSFVTSVGAMQLGRPHVAAVCTWNGHWWRHRADAYGQRNPETWEQVDVALIGDSMVYGHGVEEHDTAAAYLRGRLGVRVANLGRWGDSPVEYTLKLRVFAAPLRPRVAVVVFFQNDISGTNVARSAEQQRAFVDGAPVPELADVTREALLAEASPPRSRWSPEAIRRALLLPRAVAWAMRPETPPPHGDWAPPPSGPGTEEPDGATQPPAMADDDAPRPDETLAIEYLHAACTRMDETARGAGMTLVLVTLPALLGGRPDRFDRMVHREVDAAAKRLGLRFLDATPAFRGPDGRWLPGMLLPRDGHLTPAGHRRFGEEIARFLEAEKLVGAR
jgi:hypothetical protein